MRDKKLQSWEPRLLVSVTVFVTVSVFMSMLKSGICEMSSVKCEMSNAYIDPCFHVYAQMLLFMGENDK